MVVTWVDLCHKDVVVNLLLELCVFCVGWIHLIYTWIRVVATFRKQNCLKMPNKARGGYLSLWCADLPLLCCRGSRGIYIPLKRGIVWKWREGWKGPLHFSLSCVASKVWAVYHMLFIYPVEKVISKLPGFLRKKFLPSQGPLCGCSHVTLCSMEV